jgi:hypothetical protein
MGDAVEGGARRSWLEYAQPPQKSNMAGLFDAITSMKATNFCGFHFHKYPKFISCQINRAYFLYAPENAEKKPAC